MEKIPQTPPKSPMVTSDQNTPPPLNQTRSPKSQSPICSGRKTGTPDRLKVPKACKYPERYTSPTDQMISPVTRGILARSKMGRKLILPPSTNQPKVMSTDSDAWIDHVAKMVTTLLIAIGNNQSLQNMAHILITKNNVTMESEHVKVSNDHGKKDSEIKHDEGKPVEGKNNEVSSPCSSPSSSSSSSSRSSMEFNTGEKVSLDNISTKSKSDGNLSSSPEFISSPDTSTHSMSQTSAVGSWQIKSPPIQTMGQPANYDPSRIPSHIFSTKPTTPTDWSVASNESLFSIHMGNNSFSRDNAILFGKSGELPPWLEEWNNNSSSNLHHASEPKPSEFSSSLPPVMEVPAHEENDVKSAKVSKVLEKEDSDKVPKVPAGANVKNHAKETITPVEEARPSAAATSASLPRLSDESGNSGSSFAFPLFASESGKSRSLKVITEKQEKVQTQSHGPNATTPKASETRWFSCVFCWPRCC